MNALSTLPQHLRSTKESFSHRSAQTYAYQAEGPQEHSMTHLTDVHRAVEPESPSQGVAIVDATGALIFHNPAMCALLQLDSDTLIGKSFSHIFKHIAQLSSEPQVTELDLEMALFFIEQRPAVYLSLQHQADTRYVVKFFPVPAYAGIANGWGFSVRDISNEWHDITEQFDPVFNMLGELRILQANMQGMTSTLMTGYQLWEQQMRHDFLESLEDSVKGMERLLDYAQHLITLTLKPIQLNMRPLDVRSHIEQILRSLMVRTSGRQFQLTIADQLPMIEVDHLRFNQILHYIVDYAIHYSPLDGVIEICVSADDKTMLISVAKEISNLPSEQLFQSLDYRYRLHIDNGETFSIEQVGLRIASQLVYAHGGQLWGEKGSGHGVKYYIELPLKAFDHKTTPHFTNSTAVAVPKVNPRVQRGQSRILIAEDDRRTAEMMRKLLEREGYKVFHSTNGREALELAEVKKPDLILLDFYLPDTSGIELCTQLREFTSVPVIMVTGNEKSEDETAALYLGVDDYLRKPFNPDELLARIYANLRRAEKRDTLLPDTDEIRIRDLVVNFNLRQVSMRGQRVKLSPREFQIISLLVQNAGRVVLNDHLLERIWGPGYEGEPQHLWVYVSRLRRKIERDPSQPEYLLTEPGSGYYIPAEEE